MVTLAIGTPSPVMRRNATSRAMTIGSATPHLSVRPAAMKLASAPRVIFIVVDSVVIEQVVIASVVIAWVAVTLVVVTSAAVSGADCLINGP